jgi:hypothetical protein
MSDCMKIIIYFCKRNNKYIKLRWYTTNTRYCKSMVSVQQLYGGMFHKCIMKNVSSINFIHRSSCW